MLEVGFAGGNQRMEHRRVWKHPHLEANAARSTCDARCAAVRLLVCGSIHGSSGLLDLGSVFAGTGAAGPLQTQQMAPAGIDSSQFTRDNDRGQIGGASLAPKIHVETRGGPYAEERRGVAKCLGHYPSTLLLAGRREAVWWLAC